MRQTVEQRLGYVEQKVNELLDIGRALCREWDIDVEAESIIAEIEDRGDEVTVSHFEFSRDNGANAMRLKMHGSNGRKVDLFRFDMDNPAALGEGERMMKLASDHCAGMAFDRYAVQDAIQAANGGVCAYGTMVRR